MYFLGRTGLTWNISITICPHQMAAVRFKPMTFGLLRLGTYSLFHQYGQLRDRTQDLWLVGFMVYFSAYSSHLRHIDDHILHT